MFLSVDGYIARGRLMTNSSVMQTTPLTHVDLSVVCKGLLCSPARTLRDTKLVRFLRM